MRDGLLSLLQNVFKIAPDEARRTGMAATYLFAGIGAFIVGRIARSVLFLEIPNYHQQLPLVYVLIALAVSPSMVAYSHFERRLRRDRFLAWMKDNVLDVGPDVFAARVEGLRP